MLQLNIRENTSLVIYRANVDGFWLDFDPWIVLENRYAFFVPASLDNETHS